MATDEKSRSFSGRGLCVAFLIFLIAAAALVISIYALIQTLHNKDKINDIQPDPFVRSTTKAPTEKPETLSQTRTEVLVSCHNKVENKQQCEKEGCVWRESGEEGAPSCVFGDTAGYTVKGDIQSSGNTHTATLKRNGLQTIYDMDVFDNVNVEVEMYNDNALRIYMKGGSSPFEIPDEALNMNKPTGSGTKSYEVLFTKSPHFGIAVRRKSTGTVIFNTTLPGLIFSDQFIQITTKLPSEHLYGLGEHNHKRFKHDMNWKTWSIFTRDVAPVGDWNLYGAYPVYMNLENDGKANMVFLRNSHAMDILLQPNPYPAVTFKVIGGVLDFYIFLGPSPQEAVQQFTQAVGRPVMPPYWSLGFHICRWGYKNLTHMEIVNNRTRQAQIPQDVQWGDIDYMFHKLIYTVDSEKFGDLPTFVKRIHSLGQKFVVIVDPGVGSNSTIMNNYTASGKKSYLYQSGIDADIYVKTADGNVLEGEVWPGVAVYPDFTNPNTTKWWAKSIQHFMNKDGEGVGVDGLWVDMNEPSSFKAGSTTGCNKNKLNHPPYIPKILGGDLDNGSLYDKTICMDAKQHWGNQYQVHNLYGHSMSMTTNRALTQLKPKKRPFVVTRSSFVGTSKYAAHWLGDNQSQWRQLPWSIIGMLEFSMFGFSMIGADICGFYFDTNYELCLRWTQVGAFYPFSRNHNAAGFVDQDPANWDEAFTAIARNVLGIRYRILPYMYTLFYEAHVNGKMLARPLVFEFPYEMDSWAVDRQFLLGPAFLVTPVLEEGKRSVEGYFPTGRWFSYYNGEEIQRSGPTVTLDAPLSHINLHLRGGYIIPVQEPALTTTESRRNNFALVVCLDRGYRANGHLYWDDGESDDAISNGKYLMTNFNATNGNTLEINVAHDNYAEAHSLSIDMIEVYGLISTPSRASVNGTQLKPEQIRYKAKIFQIIGLHLPLGERHIIRWQ